ncbi:MAG TPA: DNA gyrase inhibitor YacG [Nevskiaceae bacterium]
MTAAPGSGEAGQAAPHARIGRCPQCGKPTRLDLSNPFRPFCSRRCKLIDLEGWFSGRYRIPGDPESSSSFLEDPADGGK